MKYTKSVTLALLLVVAANTVNGNTNAPCKDDQKVADAMECVADYARDGNCDWGHWTEMYINCQLPDARIDDYLLPIVEAGQCSWEKWSEGVYAPLYDNYLRDCSHEGDEDDGDSDDIYIEPPEDAPCKDDQKVADAMECVADYARDGNCDWGHWTEMYINCQLPDARIDDYLLPIVEADQCSWEQWSEGVYAPLYDNYLRDCSSSGDNGGTIVVPPSLNHCEILRLELIVGCTGLLGSFFGAIGYAGCMAAAATAWHICFENMDRRLDSDNSNIESSNQLCGNSCMDMLRNVDAPEANEYTMNGIPEEEAKEAFQKGMIFGHDLVAKVGGEDYLASIDLSMLAL